MATCGMTSLRGERRRIPVPRGNTPRRGRAREMRAAGSPARAPPRRSPRELLAQRVPARLRLLQADVRLGEAARRVGARLDAVLRQAREHGGPRLPLRRGGAPERVAVEVEVL